MLRITIPIAILITFMFIFTIPLPIAEEIPDEYIDKPFVYHYPPDKSIGSYKYKYVNHVFFRNFIKNNSFWQMEGLNPNTQVWEIEYNNENLNNWLSIEKTIQDDNMSEKITLNFTSPLTTRYRFKFAISKEIKEYVNKSNQYEYTLVVSANETEDYYLVFNWSDVKTLIDTNKITLRHGVKNNYFWFMITSVNELQQGNNFILDPLFGYDTQGTTGFRGIENRICGSNYTINEDGTADCIFGYFGFTGGWTGLVKCAIYYKSNYTLICTTEEKTLNPPDAWHQFNITGTYNLYDGTDYVLVAWAEALDGGIALWYDTGTSDDHRQNIAYNGFPDPLVPSITADVNFSIYACYTAVTPVVNFLPKLSNVYPSNNSVFMCPCCENFGITIEDNDSSFMNISFNHNFTDGEIWVGWIVYDNVSNGTYYFVICNFSLYNYTFYFNITVDDGDDTNYTGIYVLNMQNFTVCNETAEVDVEDEIDEYFGSLNLSPELLALALMILFFYFASTRKIPVESVILYFFSGLISLSLGIYYLIPFNTENIISYTFWVAISLFAFAGYCIMLGLTTSFK